MEERTIYSWIHLADIHMGQTDASGGWSRAQVMDALCRDVASMPGPSRVNWIVVTGDVAWSGAAVEYARAAEWLQALAAAAQIAPMGIFLVPGNHDVSRDADGERQLARLLEGLRSGREPIDAALADPGDRALLARRMGAYLEFARDFSPWCWDASPPAPEHRLFWMQKVRLPEETLRVRFVGLNTALLSKDEDDRGHLQLGGEQLATSINPPIEPEGELVIALGHHPLTTGWLADRGAIDAWMREHVHIHLSGHGGSAAECVHVVAGAMVRDGVPRTHGYNFCEVVDDGSGALELRVWPRRWFEAHGEFRADVESVPSENLERGLPYASHRLRARLAAPPPPARPAVSKPPPPPTADVFYVYAPEDEALIEGFDKHLGILERTGVIQSFDKRSLEDVPAIAAHVAGARVFLVLVSPSFVVSDFFHGPLMDRALERAARGEAYVVPIYLSPCEWQATKLAELEGLPRDGTPVAKLDRDTAFADIAFELRHLFKPSKRRR